MPRDLFGDVTRPSISIGNRKWYTLPVSLLSHSAIVVAVIVIPLLATDVLPQPWEKIHFDFPVTPPPPPPPPPIQPRNQPVEPPADPGVAPRTIPEAIAPQRLIEPGFEGNVASPGIVMNDVDPSVVVAPPPASQPAPPKPIRVSGVRQPQKLRDVQPTYPQMALIARVEGTVIIEATIGVDGHVVDARVLRSVQLLDNAALDAVRQWEFTPTLLNGVPVPVIMTVTVTFKLTR